jgi:LuxR family transcriptional regulator, maltose regulon positive regulatory protein
MRKEAESTKIYWLGQPHIERDGRSVRLDTRKTTALLAYLTLHDQPVSRERLAALFWPEFDQQRAPANLRHSLATLRSALPGEWLSAERDRVGVRLSDRLWVDVRRVRELISEVKSHAHGADEDCPECNAFLQEAAAEYKGEFLEGFTLPDCPEFDDWQVAERESIRSELGWALERLALAQAATSHWEQALKAARRWVSLDRLHEPAQALLIRILALSGQRSAAIRHYEAFATLLGNQLGAQPDPRTREPCDRAVSAVPGSRRRAGAFDGLLRSKLNAPQCRAAVVERGRLVDVMDRAIARGMAVISAPAGFGKSTLLSAWASRADMPTAWLSLDAADNDVHTFLLYCAAALDAAKPGLGEAAVDLLGAMPPAPAPAVMTSLVNAVSSAGTDIALVLDDYQFIQTMDIHEAVLFLVDRKPPSLRLIIATREDPPLPLARLRSHGSLGEIRADDLRFTTPEAAIFLNTSMALSLSAENVARLSKNTEGWIAGLQMAALSLQGRRDADAFIASFGGTNRYILDYLAEEVLGRQDAETQRFLLETSILGRMSAGLCEALRGRPGAQKILERLDRANLFLVALDDRRCWFRYHHLFADLLRHRLERDHPVEQINALHVRAGDWFAANGERAEAIQEYLAAKGYDRAAHMIERSYVEILSRGRLTQLLRWCREIPPDVTANRPAIGIVAAWALAWSGKKEETELLLRSVEHGMNRPGAENDLAGSRALRGDISIIRALLNDFAGSAAAAIELAQEADHLLPADHVMGRFLVCYILGRASKYQGDLESAEARFMELLRFSTDLGNIWAIAGAVFELVVLRRWMGSIEGSLALLREFESQVDLHHARGSGQLSKTFAVLGEVKREQGHVTEAVGIIENAVGVVEQWGIPVDVYTCLYYLARALRSCGRIVEAKAALEKAGLLLETSLVFASVRPGFEADQVKTWLADGDLGSAQTWARDRTADAIESPLNRHVELVSLARVRLAAATSNGELDQIIGLLREVTSDARHRCLNGLLIEALLLLARATLRRFGHEEASSAMDEAVQLACRGGFFQTLVEEGPVVADLIRAGLDAGKWADPPLKAYVERVLGAFQE